MLNEAFAYLDDEVISFFPDLVIIHFGVVEVCYRQTLRGLNNFPIQNYYLNRVFSRSFRLDSPLWRVASLFIQAANFVTRKSASLFKLKWQWLPTRDFLVVLRSAIEVILKETGANIFVVGISRFGSRVEKPLQGSAQEITAANELMQRLSPSYGERVQYLDPNRFLQLGHPDDLIPDGVHFSARGHRLMADEILAAISLLPEGKEVPAVRESPTCHVQVRTNSQG
jgi:lysophospholipase L1-like esterase